MSRKDEVTAHVEERMNALLLYQKLLCDSPTDAVTRLATLQTKVTELENKGVNVLLVERLAEFRATVATVQARVQALTEALKDSKVAIDDWLNLYAEEECNPDRVYESRKRIDDAGGTLAYIAHIQRRNKAALEAP